MSEAPGGEATVTETERWFVGRGLPHFIEDYSASRDVFTRAVPLLALLFVIEVFANAPNSDYPFWKNALAVASGFALVIVVWAIANVMRNRPLSARPDRFGKIEVALFILGPGLIALPYGGQWRSTLATLALNLVLLAAIYLITSYGIIPMTRWAVWQTLRQVETVVGLYVRSLPLLLLFVSFLFLTNEVWQTAGAIVGPTYWVAVASSSRGSW